MKRYRPKLALLIVAPLVLSSVELGCATQLQEFEPSRVAPASAPASPQPPEGIQMSPVGPDTVKIAQAIVAHEVQSTWARVDGP